MKAIKKLALVVMAVMMTMAMSIIAFGGQTVTFHFKNAQNWSTVGGWVYEGVGFTTNVTPADKCAAVNGEKQLWPGAKCDDEGNGWVKITCNFTDISGEGAVMIFNNWVADNTINDTTTEEDLDKLKESGVLCDSTKKKQTGNIMILKGAYKAGAEYWIDWDGVSTGVIFNEDNGLYTAAPASYKKPSTTTKKAATLKFGSAKVTKYYKAAAFTNKLTKKTDGKLTYKSSNTKVAKVNSKGKVTIVAAGTAKITVSSAETSKYKKASASYTITVKTLSQKITTSKNSYTVKKGAKAFSLNAKNSGTGKLTFQSNKKKVVTVDSKGKVTIKGVGSTNIVIKAAAVNGKYAAAKKVVKIVVKK